MKALTVRQPWASLIALGYKRIETRTRDTRHRGPLLIHAGLAMPCRLHRMINVGPFTVDHDEAGLLLRGPGMAWPYRLPLGALVAEVDLFQTRRTTSLEYAPPDLDPLLGDHSPGRFGWYVSSLRPIRRPIPCPGRQGLWNVPEALAALAKERVQGEPYIVRATA